MPEPRPPIPVAPPAQPTHPAPPAPPAHSAHPHRPTPGAGLGANYDFTGTACQCSQIDVNLGISGCANLPQAYATGGGGRLGVSASALGQGLPEHLSGGNMTCAPPPAAAAPAHPWDP